MSVSVYREKCCCHCFQKSDFREMTAFMCTWILKNQGKQEHTLGICHVRNTLAGFGII